MSGPFSPPLPALLVFLWDMAGGEEGARWGISSRWGCPGVVMGRCLPHLHGRRRVQHLADGSVSPFRFMAASKILGEEAANAAGAGVGAGVKEKGRQQ